jgi:N,N'-diacetyllegionaminate synthase
MNKTVIIAEAGVNHNGDIQLAKKLVDVAAEAGADYVKFQTFRAEKIASRSATKADYQKQTTSAGENQLQMLKALELSADDHRQLMEYCQAKSIAFLSTPFDLESIELLKKLGITLGKIPSGELTNLPYLEKMAESFRELVMSTGMADMQEIKEAIDVLATKGFPKEKITVLHCNTEYPTPFCDVNLQAMPVIAKEFGVKVGYSDHTAGIEVAIAATALGATLIEKHFTLDRTMEGPDHKASLEPDELIKMVQSIRNIEQALGSKVKAPTPSETKNRNIARKSLVAALNMEAGHVIRKEDLAVKRPGNGISPMLFYTIVGKKIKKFIGEDELLTPEHLAE